MTTVLDGPLGTELARRGVDLEGPAWSARALVTAPEVVRSTHGAYAAAGATVHTANTFRTTARALGEGWQDLARTAVLLARDAVPTTHRVAGSIAPLEDCYRPDLSPTDALEEHGLLARVLAEAGVDLLLCETFPHVGEALQAVTAAVDTGVETWLSLTAGPSGDLLTPAEIRAGATLAIELGAAAVLVNCVPARDAEHFARALVGLGVPFGVYANAGPPDDDIGWPPTDAGAVAYAELARSWLDLGTTIIGGCCGTGPPHVRALARLARAG